MVVKLLDSQNGFENDARVAELVVPDPRFVIFFPPRDSVQDIPGYLEGDALDVLEIAVVVHAHGDVHQHLLQGLMIVGQDGGGELGVGDDDHVVGDGPYRRVAPGDVGDVTLLP